jgi:hypothetical protein
MRLHPTACAFRPPQAHHSPSPSRIFFNTSAKRL